MQVCTGGGKKNDMIISDVYISAGHPVHFMYYLTVIPTKQFVSCLHTGVRLLRVAGRDTGAPRVSVHAVRHGRTRHGHQTRKSGGYYYRTLTRLRLNFSTYLVTSVFFFFKYRCVRCLEE